MKSCNVVCFVFIEMYILQSETSIIYVPKSPTEQIARVYKTGLFYYQQGFMHLYPLRGFYVPVLATAHKNLTVARKSPRRLFFSCGSAWALLKTSMKETRGTPVLKCQCCICPGGNGVWCKSMDLYKMWWGHCSLLLWGLRDKRLQGAD